MVTTTTYGLTAQGFVPKTTPVVNTDLQQALQAAFGASIPFTAQSLFGQVSGVLAERFNEVWAEMQSVFAAGDSDQATGSAQDAIGSLTGVLRLIATSSTTLLTCCGTPSTIIAASSLASTQSTSQQFRTTVTATIALLASWIGNTAYTVGQRVTNVGNCYQCTTAGTSAATGGPTTTASSIPDGGGSLVWEYIGQGTGCVDIPANSVNTGPIASVTGDIILIDTPTLGWDTVTNLTSATLGQNQEQDGDYRARRAVLLTTTGGSTQQAIRSDVLLVTDVTACTVLVNNTDTTDGNGQAPHSIQCVVTGGADLDVATAIYDTAPAGINLIGTSTVTVTDSQGFGHSIHFTRLTEVPIYVIITLKHNSLASTAGGYPVNGDALVAAAIGALMYTANQEVTATGVGSAAFPIYFNGNLIQGVQGVTDVPTVLIGTSPSPVSSTTIPISVFQIASFSASNVTVISSVG